VFSPYTAIFDACVLYPAQLRDLLLSLAGTGLFRARWTDEIHEEWIGALLEKRQDIDRSVLERTREHMDRSVPDCLVTGYEPLINGLTLPDPGDRHVLAAAIKARADVIVTTNLKDFPQSALERLGIEAQHPDDFVFYQLDLNPEAALRAIGEHRARLRKPARTPEEYLDSLEPLLPLTVAVLRDKCHRI